MALQISCAVYCNLHSADNDYNANMFIDESAGLTYKAKFGYIIPNGRFQTTSNRSKPVGESVIDGSFINYGLSFENSTVIQYGDYLILDCGIGLQRYSINTDALKQIKMLYGDGQVYAGESKYIYDIRGTLALQIYPDYMEGIRPYIGVGGNCGYLTSFADEIKISSWPVGAIVQCGINFVHQNQDHDILFGIEMKQSFATSFDVEYTGTLLNNNDQVKSHVILDPLTISLVFGAQF